MLRDESGLGDLSISRPKSRLDWGVELPFDRDHVCYVWFDALISVPHRRRLAATSPRFAGALGERRAPDRQGHPEAARDLLADHAEGDRARALPAPLGARLLERSTTRKVSKSLGNMISPLAMRDRYGFEAFRYFLLREMSFGLDAELQRGGARRARERGPREQPRQPGEPHAEPRREAVRRRGARDAGERATADARPCASAALADARRRRGDGRSCASTTRSRAISSYSGAVNRYLDAQRAVEGREGPGGEAAVRDLALPACEALRALALCSRRSCPRRRARSRGGSSSTTTAPAGADLDARRAGDRVEQGRRALPAARAARSRRLMWIDSHCHVSADEFAADRAAVLGARARGRRRAHRRDRRGLRRRRERGRGGARRGRTRACSRPSASTRTTRSLLDDAGRAKLRAWLAAPRVVAVGECGLDYWYEHSPRDVQRAVFAEQVALARELDLPGLDPRARPTARTPTRSCSRSGAPRAAATLEGVLHCYTARRRRSRSARSTQRLHVSFSGIVTFKRGPRLRAVAAALPLDRLLVETDAPLLAPQGQRGARNEPARVAHVGAVPRARCAGRRSRSVAAATAAQRAPPLPAPRSVRRRERSRDARAAPSRCDLARDAGAIQTRALRDRARDRHEERARRPRDRGRPGLRGADRRRAAPRAPGRRRARRGGRRHGPAPAPPGAG